ncbi:MAG: gliding motility-associated C-terminal domain-containing protein [Bacteroidia bacterium]|nr:gliding motility-associated C-terminal domain-containing protein [Bacteroidia bacterium]
MFRFLLLRILVLLTVCTGVAGAHGSGGSEGFRAIENKGQWAAHIRYRASLKAGAAFFENYGIAFQLAHPEDLSHENQLRRDAAVRCHGLRLEYISTSPNCEAKGVGADAVRYHYFTGNDPGHFATDAQAHAQIVYPDIWPGVHLLWEEWAGHMRYTYTCQRVSDAASIGFRYMGADSVRIDSDGSLRIFTSVRTLTETPPVAWIVPTGQENEKIPVKIGFCQEEEVIRFCLKGQYPEGKLVIDPTLIFSSYTGSVADNFGFTATYDNAGNLYAGGRVYAAGYPVFGAYQSSFQGMYDAAISKFNASGTQLIYSTYLGGSAGDQPHSLVVNSQDELLVLGTTESNNFPIVQATQPTPGGGYDLFISRFNAAGNQLLASTYLGGAGDDGYNALGLNYNYGDEYRGEIFVDSLDQIFVASNSASANFPVTAGCFQNALSGTQDGIVGSFSPDLFSVRWLTYLGGANQDAAYGVKVSASGKVLVTGGTLSPDFPVTSGAFRSTPGGSIDGFASVFSSDGQNLNHSTFIGTSGEEQSYFIQTDEDGGINLYGQSTGSMPIVGFGGGTLYFNTGGKQFIICLDSTLSTNLFSTVFGAGRQGPDISPTAFLVDRCGNIYCSGWGCQFPGTGNTSNQFLNTTGLPVTMGALKATTDGTDFYLMVLKKHATGLLYGTFLGGNISKEHVDGGTSRFSPQGIVYHAVCAGCGGNSDFPTTSGVVSNTNNSTNCNLAAFKVDFEPTSSADFIWQTSSLCPPYSVQFTYQGLGADQYSWDFGMGPGDTSNLQNPVQAFPADGTYDIRMIAREFTCMGSDTAVKTITLEQQPFASWAQEYTLCNPEVKFSYTGPTADSLRWEPESGTGGTGNPEQVISFPGAGQYVLTLIAWAGGCADTLQDTFRFASAPPAAFTWETDTCSREARFFSGVSDSLDVMWDFGDGEISDANNPVHQFPKIGQFPVRMYVRSDSCTTVLEKSVDLAIPMEQFRFLPNVFTPNGDGFHDFFRPELKKPERFEISIWDRWGNLIWSARNPELFWDGKVNGRPAESGVYFFVISSLNCIGVQETRQGSVTLLR